MELTWEHNGETHRARVDDRILPFVETLGCEKAAAMFLAFGGSEVYIGDNPTRMRGKLADFIGAESVASLAEWFGHGNLNLPLAREFLIRYLASTGVSRMEIARRVRVAQSKVRSTLAEKPNPLGFEETRKSKSGKRPQPAVGMARKRKAGGA